MAMQASRASEGSLAYLLLDDPLALEGLEALQQLERALGASQLQHVTRVDTHNHSSSAMLVASHKAECVQA